MSNKKIYKAGGEPEAPPGYESNTSKIDVKKFLDYEGVKHLWSKISMEDYPNNQTLMSVIEAIDETKADKNELFSGSWNDLEDKPFSLSEKQYIVKPVTLNNGYVTEYFWVPDGTACTVVINGEVKDAVALKRWDYVNETEVLIFEADGRYIVSSYSYDYDWPFTGTFEAYIPGEIRTLDSKYIGSDIARVAD